ncbi:unnamed protein product [Brassica oleracea]
MESESEPAKEVITVRDIRLLWSWHDGVVVRTRSELRREENKGGEEEEEHSSEIGC